MMHEVNVQLCERQHSSATCQILYIDPAGRATLANAGQLPPYLNGKEMEMEGALPLGTIPDAEHSVTYLHPESRRLAHPHVRRHCRGTGRPRQPASASIESTSS